MADQQHLDRIRHGVDDWNQWRADSPGLLVNLCGADFRRADLSQASFRSANLQHANFRKADQVEFTLIQAILRGQNLTEADRTCINFRGWNLVGIDLSQADLSGANFVLADIVGADFSGANLGGAMLRGASLVRAKFRGAILAGADLSDADLSGADLSGADLTNVNLWKAKLIGTIFDYARLESAVLNEAMASGIRLWETQRGKWSIKSIACDSVFWDERAMEVTRYGPGEFEKLHSEHLRVELFYRGGITKFELNTLPSLLHRLSTLHSGCGIQLRSIEATGGGAKVSIVIEDVDGSAFEKIKAEGLALQAAQLALREDAAARWDIEKRLLLDEVFPRLLASAGQHIEISGSPTGVVISGNDASVTAPVTINDLSAILPLVSSISQRRAALSLSGDDDIRLKNALHSVSDELQKDTPKLSIASSGLKAIMKIIANVVERTAEKTLIDHWQPLLDRLVHFVNLLP
jgi:uncharacterized protein YjbI with pentapeptide repeats